MKTAILIITITLFFPTCLIAQVQVGPHVRRDGTYVQPHQRSMPNQTPLDNYSTKGNINPWTGEPGHRNPNVSPAPPHSSDPFQPRKSRSIFD